MMRVIFMHPEGNMSKNLIKTLCCLTALSALTAAAEVKTLTDVLDRDVQVDVPVKRAILTFYYPDYIAATGAENFKNVVGISREFWGKIQSRQLGAVHRENARIKRDCRRRLRHQ